jgi:lysophospholipase L1-like esterase
MSGLAVVPRRRVLAFGDSLTYGWIPVERMALSSRRYPEDRRWPGVMRASLGPGYEVLEDGLNGRTTDVPDPTVPQIPGAGTDGSGALPLAIAIHMPLDLVIVMLGTNDLKAVFSRSPFRIAHGAARLIDIAKTVTGLGTDYPPPKVLLIAPPPLGPQTFFAEIFAGGEEKSRMLGPLYAGMAHLGSARFLDAGSVVETDGADGTHLTAAAHQILGRTVAAKVREILAD